jgi:DNA topoisomerase-2
MTVGKEVKVSWNDNVLKCKNLVEYAKSYGVDGVIYESPNDRWHIAIGHATDGCFNQSFVNGIWTSKGGTHVDAVVNQVAGHIVDYLETKKKTKVKPSLVRDHLAVFIVSLIENPSFTSQTKETLTTKASAFGSSPKLSEDTLKKIVSKLGIVEALLEAQSIKDSKDNTKTDGKKQSRITQCMLEPTSQRNVRSFSPKEIRPRQWHCRVYHRNNASTLVSSHSRVRY